MCRSIKTLRRIEPAVSDEEIEAAAAHAQIESRAAFGRVLLTP